MSVSPPPAGVPPPYSYNNPQASGSATSLALNDPIPAASTPIVSTPVAPASTASQWFSFEGYPAEDVDAFIQSVKRSAFAQGKQRDDAWIVDYCETSLKGEALRWFLELDEEVTQSWKAVQLAMLERFGRRVLPVRVDSEGDLQRRGSVSSVARSPQLQPVRMQTSPTPLSTPPMVSRFSASLPQSVQITPGRVRTGYLQVVNDLTWASLGHVSSQLSSGRFGALGTGPASAQPLAVEVVESEKMHDMRLLNVNSEHGFFGLTMFSKGCPVSETSNGPLYPSATEHSMRPLKLANSYNDISPCASAVWKVHANGLVEAYWYTKSGTLVKLSCCGYSPPNGGTAQLLTFLPDPSKFLEANPAWVEVVLVFQERL